MGAPSISDPKSVAVISEDFVNTAVSKATDQTTGTVPDYKNILIRFEDRILGDEWIIQTPPDRRNEILNSVLDAIGETPMIRLRNIERVFGLQCELVAKCEFLNPGGSVKDRIAKLMVQWEVNKGRLNPGDLLIEATSGNTGIGLAMVAASQGYRLAITMPHKMSAEKSRVLEALGAQVIRTRTTANWNDPDSHISIAYNLKEVLKTPDNNVVVLDQYQHPGNPWAHYYFTGMEIVKQTKGQVDVVVVGAGTGGTVSGIAKAVKEKVPKCKIVAVDPIGSILRYGPDNYEKHLNEVKSYQVEGIGYDFIPSALKCELIDEWVDIGDTESFLRARDIVFLEGLLVGGSSGTALAAALKVCAPMREEQRCVVVFPDSSRNYLNKFLNNNWMAFHSHMPLTMSVNYNAKDSFWKDLYLWNFQIEIEKIKNEIREINCDVCIGTALLELRNNKCSQALVSENKNKNKNDEKNDETTTTLLGVISAHSLANKIIQNKFSMNTKLKDVISADGSVCMLADTSMASVASLLQIMRECLAEELDPMILVLSDYPVDLEDEISGIDENRTFRKGLNLKNPIEVITGAVTQEVLTDILTRHRC